MSTAPKSFNWDLPLFLGWYDRDDDGQLIPPQQLLELCQSDALLHWQVNRWFRWAVEDFWGQIAVLGITGSGKSTTLLTLAFQVALQWRWPVVFIEAKGSDDLRRDFCRAMRLLGRRVRVFPTEPYCIWRGSPSEVVNRLMGMQDFSEPYYKSVAEAKIAASVAVNPPKNSEQFLARLRKEIDPRVLAEAGVLLRYEGLFAALSGAFDGDWAIEDIGNDGAAYLALDSTGQPGTARYTANGLLLDALASLRNRRRAGPILILFDEFGAAPAEAALDLVERGRSFGANFVVAAQGYEGLGETPDFRERIWAGSNTQIIHRLARPDTAVDVAGTVLVPEKSQQYSTAQSGTVIVESSGSMREQHQFAVPLNQIRRLPAGHAAVIRHGHWAQVKMARWKQSVPDWWWHGFDDSGHTPSREMYEPPAPPLYAPPAHPHFAELVDLRQQWERTWRERRRLVALGRIKP